VWPGKFDHGKLWKTESRKLAMPMNRLERRLGLKHRITPASPQRMGIMAFVMEQ